MCLQSTSLLPLAFLYGENGFQGTLLTPLSSLLSGLMMFDGQEQGRLNIPLDLSQTQRPPQPLDDKDTN